MADLEDAQGQYEFKVTMLNGKTYKQAWGWLGMPDQVQTRRSSSGQKNVAGG